MDEIMQCHILIRQQLSHHQEKEILVTFGVIVQKHFPSLINFLWKLKLSVLERLQMKKIKLDSSLEFIKPRLSCRLGDELAILNLLEDMQRRKFHLKAVEFLKEVVKCFKILSLISCDLVFILICSRKTNCIQPEQQKLL